MRLIILLLILGYATLSAQVDATFDTEDSTAFNTIAVYPHALRQSIFESCQYPELILKVEGLQKKTSEKFKTILNDYYKKEQEKFWELSRQPGLIAKIVDGGHKSEKELEIIALSYPSTLKETIVSYGSRFYWDLEEIRTLEKKSESEFNTLLKTYPESVQNSMHEVVKHPEIIGVLCDHMKVAVTIGDLYKTKKERLNVTMDSLSTINADLKAKEFSDWKEGLEKDTEAKKEMYDAAKEFSKDQGETISEPNSSNVTINYLVDPYPYWFGYPWWYTYPYWYPYPYWYNWGFYAGPSGFVYIGLPSPFFTHWYFSHHYHHYYYNHFSDYCISHYYGHRNSHEGFNKEVRSWTNVNEPQLPRQFLNNDGQRAVRLKQLGQYNIGKEQNISLGRPKYSKEDIYRIPGGNLPRQTQLPRVNNQPQLPVINVPRNSSTIPINPQRGTSGRRR